MKTKLKRLILLSLLAADGMPMPESALVSAVRMGARPDEPTDGDIFEALREVEAGRYAAGVSDEFTGRSWTLTERGTHQARKLR